MAGAKPANNRKLWKNLTIVDYVNEALNNAVMW
jgi:hypothetical protein